MQLITLKGKDFPILFDINAAEAIQKRYGSIELMGEKLADFGEMKWVLTTVINEGIAYENYENGAHTRKITEDELGMLMSIKDIQSQTVTQAIIDAFNESFSDEKNVTAADLQTVATEIMKNPNP